MPTVRHLRPIHRRANRLLMRVNVAFCDVHVAMSGEVGERPRVHVRSPSRSAAMTERIQFEALGEA